MLSQQALEGYFSKKLQLTSLFFYFLFFDFGFGFGGFFYVLRGERLPGEGLLSFLAKKKVTKESCLGDGNELNAHRAIASLGSWHLDVRAVGVVNRWLVLPPVRQQLHALLDLVCLRCARAAVGCWLLACLLLFPRWRRAEVGSQYLWNTDRLFFINCSQSLP